MNPLLHVLTLAVFPVAAAIGGAVIAAYRPPRPKTRSFIQHLAAGVVFSVVAVELLPEIRRAHAPVQVAVGFALGVLVMLGMRELTHKLEAKGGGGNSTGLLVGIGIDILLDGLLIGISAAAGPQGSKLLTAALTLELLSLGLAVASSLGKAGVPRPRIIGLSTGLSFLIVAGAVPGMYLMRGISPAVLEIVLSFGLAALLYLVTEELLVEAHEEPETPLATGVFFAGFLLFLILGMCE